MDSKAFLDHLLDKGLRFYAGVPDSYLHGFCTELRLRSDEACNMIAANEGNAIGLAVGHYLATGEVAAVYMQNSGLGNAVNPLVSLAGKTMLGVPLILLIGWRGDPFHGDHVQHELQGRITPGMLEDMLIPSKVLDESQGRWKDVADWALQTARDESCPVAILVPKGVLSGTKEPISDASYALSREEAIEAVLDFMPEGTIYCATTGRASRELFYLRDARGEAHDCDYLNVGSMGHASSVALGIALAHRDRKVVCLDGDGAAIMHLGAFAMAATYPAGNLIHIILNNGAHESVGNQPSAGFRIDFTEIARACGYAVSSSWVSDAGEAARALEVLMVSEKPAFLDFRIHAGMRNSLPGLEVDPKTMCRSLMRELVEDDRNCAR